MSDEIKELKNAAGAFKKDALKARKKFIDIRRRQDIEIRNLYIRLADKIAKQIREISTAGNIPNNLEDIEKQLRAEADVLGANLTKAFKEYINAAVEGGIGYSRAVTIKLLEDANIDDIHVSEMFYRVNTRAVEECWKRTTKGFTLSDKIWEKADKFSTNITDILQEAIALGQDAVQTARFLEVYVRQDFKTAVKDYENMMKHLKGRVPEDVCYEALRLARTETTAAFGKATIAAANAAPSYKGMKWVLSKSHPISDICDELASHDEGLGLGVYSPGNEPIYPAHPNDMCFLVPVHEEPDDFVQRLKQWRNNPNSQPDLEKWYNETYQGLIKG